VKKRLFELIRAAFDYLGEG